MQECARPWRAGLKSWLPAMALVLASGCVGSLPPAPQVEVAESLPVQIAVDERMELLGIIFRLAGAEEYNSRAVPAYADAIDAYFAPHKNHPTVLAVKELRSKHGISHNAVADLAVRMTPMPDLRERAGLVDGQMDERWDPDVARAFIAQVGAFARDTNATAFFAQQQPLYRIASRRMSDLVANETNLRWIYDFYGGTPKDRFIIAPSPGNGTWAYGPRVMGENGQRELYAFMSIYHTDEDGNPAIHIDSASVVAHEFGHSFVNPVVQDSFASIRPSADMLRAAFGKPLEQHGYNKSFAIIHESIIRAGVARYKLAHHGPDAARKELKRQTELGFVWVNDLYDLLGEYENSRDRYPTFANFYPRIQTYFQAIPARMPQLTRTYDALRPQVVETVPANGSSNVDPNIKLISIRFSKRMSNGFYGLDQGPGGKALIPDVKGVSFDASRQVFNVTVELKPNRSYEFRLISSDDPDYRQRRPEDGDPAFRSAQGIPLPPYLIRFRTAPAPR